MSVIELLEKWGLWLARCGDHGLGYKQSSLNLVAAAASSKSSISLLPYGVDEGEVFCAVDRAVCSLPKLHRLILIEEYCRPGSSIDKYKSIGIGKTSYFKYLGLAHAQVEMNILNKDA